MPKYRNTNSKFGSTALIYVAASKESVVASKQDMFHDWAVDEYYVALDYADYYDAVGAESMVKDAFIARAESQLQEDFINSLEEVQ